MFLALDCNQPYPAYILIVLVFFYSQGGHKDHIRAHHLSSPSPPSTPSSQPSIPPSPSPAPPSPPPVPPSPPLVSSSPPAPSSPPPTSPPSVLKSPNGLHFLFDRLYEDLATEVPFQWEDSMEAHVDPPLMSPEADDNLGGTSNAEAHLPQV